MGSELVDNRARRVLTASTHASGNCCIDWQLLGINESCAIRVLLVGVIVHTTSDLAMGLDAICICSKFKIATYVVFSLGFASMSASDERSSTNPTRKRAV